ncbi:MAG TPA: hypothetical protein VFL62_24810 [Bradyrhizobium sp.]|uniref:hypothetical protein n=1 Tax=Bradyrhizobium sp. TaxID=376 RepID=UPI002D7EC22D|nr:hypothetical protein [Bradyrhizobium sp.]HET7889465.1 hypothetical protein [Bradyrhizobium sp.]
MSGHRRFCVAASLLVAGLSSSPASSNALTDLFNPAPQEAAAPAPAPVQQQCLSQPGRSAAPGQHWVYHLEGHRKCWFQADAATVAAKRPIYHHTPKRPVVAPEENEAELHKKAVLDARAQVLSAAPASAPQAAASAPEVAEAAPAPAREAAVAGLAAPMVAPPTIDAPDKAPPHSVDVEMLLAASTDNKDMAAPSVPMAATSVPSTTADEPSAVATNAFEFTVARAGTGLIALGFAFLLGALLVNRFLDQRGPPIGRT